MKTSTAIFLVATTAVLSACNAPDPNRTTKSPPGVSNPTAVIEPLVTPSAPPAPAERGPVAASANTAAPGTNASVAFAQDQNAAAATAKPTEAVAVDAQQAVAKAPDTASADAAKTEVRSSEAAATGKGMAGTAEDTSANNPRHGTLTPGEESNQMPKAGQANNHSSPALENDSGRGQKP